MPAEPDLTLLRRPFTPREARRAGWTRAELARGVRSGALVRLRHGVLLPRAVYDELDSVGKHRLHVVAHRMQIAHDCVASHASAATLLGLPVLWRPVRVELTSPTGDPRDRDDLRLHKAPLPAAHRSQDEQDVPITSAARTVADCARTQSLGHSLAVADAALHRGLLTRQELTRIGQELGGWPGAQRVARIAVLAAPAESPGESLARVDLVALGFADPKVQAAVLGLSGKQYRVDILLVELGVIVEFDGAVKYGGLGRRPGTEALRAEKQREDDLRLAGWGIVRVTWRELGNLELLRRKIEVAARLSTRGQSSPGGPNAAQVDGKCST